MMEASTPSQRQAFLFGPQFLSFTSVSLDQLTAQCRESTGSLEWVLQTLSELPRHWESITETFPELGSLPVEKRLQEVLTCMESGDSSQLTLPLSNFLLCPFVVISQLTQYMRYRRQTQSPSDRILLTSADVETVGFCTGLLSALAVSCSTTQGQLELHGATAVRLALLVGAIVDIQNAGNEFVSISVAWSTQDGKENMSRILETIPQAYVSVTYDENRSTVTTSKDTSSTLQQHLREAGMTVTELSLQGRFHDPGRSEGMNALVKFCDAHEGFSLPNAHHLVLPTRSRDGDYITHGSLHEIALKGILVEHCDWYRTFTALSLRLANEEGSIISFGLERCVPQSLLRDTSCRLVQMADVDAGKAKLKPRGREQHPNDDAIAVIGMSCRVPGASDLEDFWTRLCENKSQHVEVPSDRFEFDTAWRKVDPQRKWFGNFVQDFNAFDHKFFNKSPREATAMDPQQKMMLQAAYQAVEQSGYFQPSRSVDKHIGCYIGVSNVDYQDNVACHPATAFTATGTLMSFVAGKIGHFFGWTGPAMSIDTACSGSSVAVHEAVKAILSGDCTAALAGGVNAITSPLWFQNLAGASFLSTTGQCKPFDADGDGYCRGEAVGAMFLKRLSAAIADGDPILGTIAASAVHQNQNCTAITVPNSLSLSNLFEDVIGRAKLDAGAITFVEAHGTGTAVGDPAEYAGIRKALGGSKRSDTLALRSVKGLVGHAECASGMVALVKTLLQIQKGFIAPQASHHRLNPALEASPMDRIEISTTIKPWDVPFKAALINNYGASGSNASMVVTEPPSTRSHRKAKSDSGRQHPFWFCGADEERLQAYVSKFTSQLALAANPISLCDLSYNVAVQSNRSLGCGLIFHASSFEELNETLLSFQSNKVSSIKVAKPSRPVILCFGGQVSTFVGLNLQVFENIAILRKHLDRCDLVCKSMGLSGIYPDIFQREPILDTVRLQTALFAMQYSCAMSWIDCGLQVAAAVGHSFGEIVAQTVAGALTLSDGLKIIARRARLIRDSWESDRGSMMAMEADVAVVEEVMARANTTEPLCNRPAAIACVNGSRSFTVAGSTESITKIEELLSQDKGMAALVRYKKLNTSHAFHSTLVEPLIPELEQLTHDIVFHVARIRVERAIKTPSNAPLTSSYIAEHLRQPVYFNNAVQRLANEYGDAVWIEAGSQSTVTNMAAKALGMPKSSHFQAMALTGDDAWSRLNGAFVAVWKQGVNVDFWPHHPSQTTHYSRLLLPPYQFQKSNHYLDLKKPLPISNLTTDQHSTQEPRGLWTLADSHGASGMSARFRVETSNSIFQELMAGHTVAHSQPLCPSTLQLDIATEAIRSLCPEFDLSNFQIDLRNLENQTPICRDASRVVWLDVEAMGDSRRAWSWKMVSNPISSDSVVVESRHASGKVLFRRRDDPEFLDEFDRFARLVTHDRCLAALNGGDDDEILQGEAIYKLFADVVDYSEVFRGVRKVVGRAKGTTSAGRVVKRYSDETWLDTPLCDSFCQVAGMFVNCMTQRSNSDAFISSGVHRIVRSPSIVSFEDKPEAFDVFALHHQPSEKSFSSDVFIFHSNTSQLLGVILGIQYQRVSKVAMSKLLARLTPDAERTRPVENAVPALGQTSTVSARTSDGPKASAGETSFPPTKGKAGTSETEKRIVAAISEMVGVDSDKITPDTDLTELGIDSLMGMELSREIELMFKCTLDMSAMMQLVDVGDLIKCVRSTLGETESGVSEATLDLDNVQSSSSASSPPGESNATSESPRSSSGVTSPMPQAYFSVRQAAIDLYVAKYSTDFSMNLCENAPESIARPGSSAGHCVLITGATGSLGSHLVEHFASLASIGTVVCFNRPSGAEPRARMLQALDDKGIVLGSEALAKLQVIASDTSKPRLGLENMAYWTLASHVTHVVHCAWPMSITRSVCDFEKQFVAMRNLLDFARDVASTLPRKMRVGFQFVSSIATVGMYPFATGKATVAEDVSNTTYALPSGYSDAKLVCEQLVAQTLGRHPEKAVAMAVRVGQISGSRTSGYWNTAEHFSLLIKSAHTLKALPDLPGELSWLPANDVAAALADLVLSNSPSSPIFHVENPVRQPWSEVTSILAEELGIPPSGIIAFEEWLERVRNFPRARDADNPARRVMTFLEMDFLRMACGGLVLGTEKAAKTSATLRTASQVEESLVRRYVQTWRERGFL